MPTHAQDCLARGDADGGLVLFKTLHRMGLRLFCFRNRTSHSEAPPTMMVATYALLFLFDFVLLVLLLLVFAEKRRVRKEVSKMSAAESNIMELMKSMEQLIDEYKRVASQIEDDTCEKRDQLMRTIDRADRLLMELVRRSDRFELAMSARSTTTPDSERTEPARDVSSASSSPQVETPKETESTANELPGRQPDGTAPTQAASIVSGPKRGIGLASLTKLRRSKAVDDSRVKPLSANAGRGKAPAGEPSARPSFEIREDEVDWAEQVADEKATQRAAAGASASGDGEMLKTKRLVLDLSKQGLDVDTIARSLRIPVGEVKLILNVLKTKPSPQP